MKPSLVHLDCATLNDVYKISSAGHCPKRCRTRHVRYSYLSTMWRLYFRIGPAGHVLHTQSIYFSQWISISSAFKSFELIKKKMKACDPIINPRFSSLWTQSFNNNLWLFVIQVSPQRTPPTRQAVAIRAILASGCHTQQVIPWRACTTNSPAITTTTWRHSCHTTRSSSAGFTMYMPCICELAPRQCIPLTANSNVPTQYAYLLTCHSSKNLTTQTLILLLWWLCPNFPFQLTCPMTKVCVNSH